jgi:nitroimidazol reductase NimA-like FMN-containing flavoprotein (pyridoxamine 5'-phosphate oxidase superfamily)
MDDQRIKDLIRENSVGVVSTIGAGGVASAAVYYVTDAEGAIYFHSKRES